MSITRILDDWHACTFTFIDPDRRARNVQLVSDINGWQRDAEPEAMRMRADGENAAGEAVFSTVLLLVDGYYRYKFYVDGVYVADTRFNLRERFGHGNSVMVVGLGHVATAALECGDALHFPTPWANFGRDSSVYRYIEPSAGHCVEWATARGVDARPLFVALPPSYYTDPTRRYPVLYCLDGQNVFTSDNGLHVESTAAAMWAESLITEFILVGVPSREVTRKQELCPRSFWHFDVSPMARLLIDGIKPYIDATLRTRPEPESTGILGASFGALFAFCALFVCAETFRIGICLSPSMWFLDADEFSVGDLVERVGSTGRLIRRMALYMDAGSGDDDLAQLIEAQYVARLLGDYGLVSQRDFLFQRVEGHGHNEAAWRTRLRTALFFAFQRAPPAMAVGDGVFGAGRLGPRGSASSQAGSSDHGDHVDDFI